MMSVDEVFTMSQEIETFQKNEWEIVDEKHLGRVIDWSKETIILVARDSNELVGVLEMVIQAGVMHIESLIVKHTMRGNGVGRALVEKAEGIAKNTRLHKVYLETGENWEATKFYEALGYQKTGILQNHFENQDYLVYTKFLNQSFMKV